MILHTGNLPPYMTSFALFPEKNISVFISINIPDVNGHSVVLQQNLFDRLLGFELTAVMPCNNNYIPNAKIPIPLMDLDVDEYIGVYAHPVFGSLEILESNGQLQFLMGRMGNGTVECRKSAR